MFKAKYKAAGVKCCVRDGALNGFLSMISNKHEELSEYFKQIHNTLTESEQIYLKFLATTGLRPCEALNAFNLIIKLHGEGRLAEYYNQAFNCLDHYKYRDLFLRKTKNCYISFVPKSLIERIVISQPINYNRLKCALKRGGFKLRLKQLRSYHNSFLHKSALSSELVDMIAGRIPARVLVRHHLTVNMQQLSGQVLSIQQRLLEGLYQ